MAQLTPEQQQQFMASLESDQGGVPDPSGGNLSSEDQNAAFQEGMQMAAADAAQQGQAPQGEVPAQEDANAQLLSQLGYSSIEELANAYKNAAKENSEMRQMLDDITAMKKSIGNEEAIDPSDPNFSIRTEIRNELAPLYEKMRADARNRVIKSKWNESAKSKPDLNDFMGDISQYINDHPDLAMADDGLDRAYDAVRSAKYRSQDSILSDPEVLKKMADNENVKQMVIEKYLQDVARNGDVPQTISSGGNTPLSEGKKMTGMEQARSALAAKLGMK